MKWFYGDSYHRYFEGYTEIIVPNKFGKGTHIKRVYTGEFYQQNVENDTWKRQRILYGFCYAFSIIAFVTASVQKVASNTVIYVVLPSAFCILGLFWLSYGLIPFLAAGRKLKCGEYRNRMTVLSASFVAGIFYSLAFMGTLYFLLTEEKLMKELVCMLLYGLGAVFLFWLHVSESRAEYIKVENKTDKLKDGYDIRLGAE